MSPIDFPLSSQDHPNRERRLDVEHYHNLVEFARRDAGHRIGSVVHELGEPVVLENRRRATREQKVCGH